MTGPARSSLLQDRLARGIVIGDGAMGTLLHARGIPYESGFEHLNLTRPDLVRQVHADYLEAGSDLLETNTFGANALRLAGFGQEGRVREINLAGAQLARSAAGQDHFVAGAVGPLPRPRGADQSPWSPKEIRAVFTEQMTALAEGGIDAFLLETFADLESLQVALAVAREVGLPAICQMAFLEGGVSRDGVSAEQAADVLSSAGAMAVGANCGTGPRELGLVVRRMLGATRLPVSVFPNSGFPQYHEGRLLYLTTPEYFAAQGEGMVRAGVSLIGGCCGTTPEHIQALARRVASLTPGPRVAFTPGAAAPPSPEPAPSERGTFLDVWGSRTIITVELDPPKSLDCAPVLRAAGRLAEAGADAISLAENPLARVRMGNLALAQKIQEETGLEVIVHITCRDRNLIGLHSDLMGAHLMGIRTILAVTGDPVAVSGESGATSVYDLNSVGLLELLSSLNTGRTMMGTDLKGTTGFLLGAAFNPNPTNLDGQLRRLKKKMAAGARFVQTQPVYSAEILHRLAERTAPLGIPVLVGIMPVVSERNAEFLHNEVPGIVLSDEVRARMRGKGGDEGAREGIAIARELIEAGRGVVGGYYLIPPFGRVELALELIDFIRSAGP